MSRFLFSVLVLLAGSRSLGAIQAGTVDDVINGTLKMVNPSPGTIDAYLSNNNTIIRIEPAIYKGLQFHAGNGAGICAMVGAKKVLSTTVFMASNDGTAWEFHESGELWNKTIKCKTSCNLNDCDYYCDAVITSVDCIK